MIQLNLLPDIKVQFIKTRQTKRLIMGVSLAAIAASVLLVMLSISLRAVQKQHLSNLDKDIQSLRQEITSNDELTKVLSVQNQLNVLPALYNGRPAADRLTGYINQITPIDAGISKLIIDFSQNTLEIEGTASTLETVYKYVDTIKFTSYKVIEGEEESDASNAFSAVVLSDFSREADEASFRISMNFDPVIFDVTQSVSLVVPTLQTTRAQVPTPDLFVEAPKQEEAE